MKRHAPLFLVLATLACALMGCGGGGKVDTAKLQAAFQGAPAETKGDIDQAAQAIRSGDYGKAAPILKKVIKAGSLSQPQKDAVAETVTGMQMVVSKNPNKYSVEEYNALSDLIDYLEGREPIVRKP